MLCGRAAAVDFFEQQLRCAASHFAMLNADGSQRRRDQIDQRHVVVPNHRNIIRAAQAEHPHRIEYSEREQIVGRHDRGNPLRCRQ